MITSQPPAQSFEVGIARNIKRKCSLFKAFKTFDEDEDGKISKKDLKAGLRSMFEMELSDDQIEHIFHRSAYFAAAPIESLEPNGDSSESLTSEKMGFPEFSNYIEQTANTVSSNSSVNFMSSDVASSPLRIPSKGKGEERRALSAKEKDLKRTVYKHIQQRVPSTAGLGSGINFSFLQMDTLRNNQITGKEFQEWLTIKNGLNFSDEDMKLIRGNWRKDEGLSYQEFDYFVNCLGVDSGMDDATMIQRLSLNNHPLKVCQNGNSKTDVELIWFLLNYFRDYRKTFVEAFEILDASNSSGLSAQDIRAGLEVAGVSISLDRAKLLTSKYVKTGGRMTKPGFVRMMTSVPKVIENL